MKFALKKSKFQVVFFLEDIVRRSLLYPHVWVRLAASELIGFLFAAYRPEEFVAGGGGIRSNEYLIESGKFRIVEICEDCCAQLRSHELTKILCDQVKF